MSYDAANHALNTLSATYEPSAPDTTPPERKLSAAERSKLEKYSAGLNQEQVATICTEGGCQ